MKRFIFILAYIFYCGAIYSSSSIDSLLNTLEQTIDKKDEFFAKKSQRINELNSILTESQTKRDLNKQYDVYCKLYNEYESFIYDSAFTCAGKILNTAYLSHDKSKIAEAKTKFGFVLLSSGLFKESLDTLYTIKVSGLSNSIKIEYFSVISRTFYDLADYSRDNYFSTLYKLAGNRYIDSAIHYVDKNSSNYWSLEGLRRMKCSDYKGAQDAFKYLMTNYEISDHQYAIASSSLGYIYSITGQEDMAIEMLIKSAIADLKSSTKETVALRNLSDLIYKKGDVKTAYRYIKLALDDASFYNARHRKIEIASILPIIEGEKLNTVEKQKNLLVLYSSLLTLLSILVIVFAGIIFRQLKKLKQAKQIIQNANTNLMESNYKLMEVNKIKDEYIGYFFNINSEYIDKIEKFQKDISRKLTVGRVEEIKSAIQNIDLKKEREELYHSFDKIFLKLFPDFVNTFNSFFKEEDRIILKDNQLLNTDLRIFALIRMGISDNEKIAKILEYSVNTIYTYKTKIKNKSLIPNEEFEERIMQIKAT